MCDIILQNFPGHVLGLGYSFFFFLKGIYSYKELNLLLLKMVSLCLFVPNHLYQAKMMKAFPLCVEQYLLSLNTTEEPLPSLACSLWHCADVSGPLKGHS